MDKSTTNRRIRVVVAGKTPPPIGGQNINIERILRLLGTSDRVEVLYWEWGFTKSWGSRKKLGFDKFVEMVRAIWRLVKLRLDGPLDCVLYSSGGPDILPIMRDILLLPVTRLFSKKVCVYFQAAGIARRQSSLPWIVNCLNRLIHRLCWGAVVITDFGKVDAMALGIENITVLPYGIEDRNLPEQKRKSEPASGKVPVLLNVGHLCADKGTPQLIAACSDLHREGFEFSLRLVGECLGPYSPAELHQDLVDAQLGDRVSYLGLLQGEELWQAYREADLFVFSSVAPYESFGLVLLEAMMMELPAVVTDWRANADVLGRGDPSGGVITSADELIPLKLRLKEALKSAITRHEHWEEWGARNRARYLKEFSIDVYRARLEAYFGGFA